MKRLITTNIIFLIMVLFCIGSSMFIERKLGNIESVVENAVSKLEDGNKEDCQSLIKHASLSLNKEKNTLTLFINHELYDELSDSLTSMVVYSTTDKTEFLKEYEILKEKINSIIEHESINLKGVF